jgi:predicted transposase/invertase (TIGR01784 family)
MQLLDPKNDFVFKRLFADAPELLAALINAVRSTEPPVEVVEVLNPRIEPEELTGKFIVLDVLAQDAQGRRYNIEMQVRRYSAWSARSAYYLARTLTQQLNGGDDYRKRSTNPILT